VLEEQTKKISTTLKLASEQKVPYQTLINALLRKELEAV